MAKFLDGPGIQASLTELIKSTQSGLFIISPYLKISTTLKNYLTSIDKKKIPINIVYRSDSKISDDDIAYFKGLTHLTVYQCDNLHSKCYINEQEGLITSMNLHEHSQTHNWEMGIRFSKQEDKGIYSDVIQELKIMTPHLKQISVDRLTTGPLQKNHSTPIQRTVHKPTEAPNKSLFIKILDTVTGQEAFCIRCGKPIEKFNLQMPYCDKCYSSWVRYKNIKYKEKFCHACGCEERKNPTTFEKPVCKQCFVKLYPK